MKQLSKELLTSSVNNHISYQQTADYPEKVLQFGKGNFLRAFFDWQVERMNRSGLFKGKIVIYQPAPSGSIDDYLKRQDYLYTVVLRGIQDEKKFDQSEVISSISRTLANHEWNEVLALSRSINLEFVVSNTTESGITYMKESKPKSGEIPQSFPAKMTALLFERYEKLGEYAAPGLFILPCELIENNGNKLEEYILQTATDWELPPLFHKWVSNKNKFYNTLVDRIVTGYPGADIDAYQDALGYSDIGLTVGEPYHMFVIEGDEELRVKLPLEQAGLNVKWGDITTHREIKVRLLNGPHTMMFSIGFLSGLNTVQSVMEQSNTRAFIDRAFTEISSTLTDSETDKQDFINSVIERFMNPYNKHYLLDIGLNAVYKFKSRLLPTMERHYEEYHALPKTIVFSLASLFAFYRPKRQEADHLIGIREDGEEYKMKENRDVLDLLTQAWNGYDHGDTLTQVVNTLLSATHVWDRDLTKVEQLPELVTNYLERIVNDGMESSVIHFLEEQSSINKNE